MSHFAKVLDGTVIQVIVAEPDFFNVFVDSTPGTWIQTSYNTRGGVHYNPETMEPDGGVALRFNFASVGDYYDEEADAFYEKKMYNSWTLNTETYLWEAPVAYPDADSDERYGWDEETTSWQIIE
jgi:hypothetical protein